MLFLYVIGFGGRGFCFFVSLDEVPGSIFACVTSWNLNLFMNVKYETHDTLLLGLSDVNVSITLFPRFYCFCSPIPSPAGVHRSGLLGDVISHFLTLSIADWVSENWMTQKICPNAPCNSDTKYTHLPSTEINSVFNISANVMLLLKFNAHPKHYSFLFCIPPTKWSPKWEGQFLICWMDLLQP